MGPYIGERHYAATTEETWAALREVVHFRYKVKSEDQLGRAISFGTGMTAFTAGQNLDAAVIPSGDGVLVRITASARMSTNLANGSAQQKAAAWVYDNLGQCILSHRG